MQNRLLGLNVFIDWWEDFSPYRKLDNILYDNVF